MNHLISLPNVSALPALTYSLCKQRVSTEHKRKCYVPYKHKLIILKYASIQHNQIEKFWEYVPLSISHISY